MADWPNPATWPAKAPDRGQAEWDTIANPAIAYAKQRADKGVSDSATANSRAMNAIASANSAITQAGAAQDTANGAVSVNTIQDGRLDAIEAATEPVYALFHRTSSLSFSANAEQVLSYTENAGQNTPGRNNTGTVTLPDGFYWVNVVATVSGLATGTSTVRVKQYGNTMITAVNAGGTSSVLTGLVRVDSPVQVTLQQSGLTGTQVTWAQTTFQKIANL